MKLWLDTSDARIGGRIRVLADQDGKAGQVVASIAVIDGDVETAVHRAMRLVGAGTAPFDGVADPSERALDLVLSIERHIEKLSDPEHQEDPDSRETVVAAINAVDVLKAKTRELSGHVEAAAVACIKRHGDIVVGEIRYYAGTEKTTKVIDKAGCLEAVLNAAAGDLGAVCEQYMVSEPFKPGACKELLGEEAAQKLFKTEIKDELKEGKPARNKLMKADSRFIKPKKPNQKECAS